MPFNRVIKSIMIYKIAWNTVAELVPSVCCKYKRVFFFYNIGNKKGTVAFQSDHPVLSSFFFFFLSRAMTPRSTSAL